ncbi:MAG TPA: hypothetical protein VGB93_08800, partial [Methylovirgula sp.]
MFDARRVKAFGQVPLTFVVLMALPTFGFAQAPAPQAAPSVAAPASPAAPTAAPTQAPPAPPPSAAASPAKAPPAGAPVATQPAISAAKPALAAPDSNAPVSITSQLLPQNLSAWGMFLNADIIVKIVMVGLALASLATWTVWLVKSLELANAKRKASRQLGILAHAATLDAARTDLGKGRGPVVRMVDAAAAE